MQFNVIFFNEEDQIDPKYKEIFSDNSSSLHSDEIEESYLAELFPKIKEWKIRSLGLYVDKNILPKINHIVFQNLQTIFLEQKAESIEGINRIRLPVLSEFYMSRTLPSIVYNNICSISDFKKTDWPLFTYLSLRKKLVTSEGNKIKQGSDMTRMHLETVQNLNIEYWNEDHESCYDFRWVVKLKSKKMKEFRVRSEKRIKNEGIKKAIEKRYPQIQMSYNG